MKKLPTIVKQELKLVASKLPPITRSDIRTMTRVYGSTLIEKGITTIKEKGKDIPVYPDQTYIASHDTPVDHFQQMRDLFLKSKTEEEGWIKVRYYQNTIREKFDQDYIKTIEESQKALNKTEDGNNDQPTETGEGQ